jgi:purine-binding chemotaxis protein CheW
VSDTLPFGSPPRTFIVFRLEDRLAAFPSEAVERITPVAELLLPPGLPAALEGVLNLAGLAVPVLRLEKLFRLRVPEIGLYSMLIVLRLAGSDRLAVLVDRVTEILQVPENSPRPLDRDDFFNGCAEAMVSSGGDAIYVLSSSRIVLAKERDMLAEFRDMAQHRLQEWEGLRV